MPPIGVGRARTTTLAGSIRTRRNAGTLPAKAASASKFCPLANVFGSVAPVQARVPAFPAALCMAGMHGYYTPGAAEVDERKRVKNGEGLRRNGRGRSGSTLAR